MKEQIINLLVKCEAIMDDAHLTANLMEGYQ